MPDELDEEMVASYEVEITGIERTKREAKLLDDAIRELRSGDYGGRVGGLGPSSSNPDIFVTKIASLEGRVQTATQHAMIEAMDYGKEIQAAALNAASTAYGESGRPGGSTGRNQSGAFIKALKRNVEVVKTASTTVFTGWHGWAKAHPEYFDAQERGSRSNGGHKAAGAITRRKLKRGGAGGVPAANSLGFAIVFVREKLKADLARLR